MLSLPAAFARIIRKIENSGMGEWVGRSHSEPEKRTLYITQLTREIAIALTTTPLLASSNEDVMKVALSGAQASKNGQFVSVAEASI